jgi:hypothetical protein
LIVFNLNKIVKDVCKKLLYSIQEASKELNISRVTIYNKIKNCSELKKFVKVRNNVKYLMPEGLEIIKQSIVDNDSKYVNDNNTDYDSNHGYHELLNGLKDLQNNFTISLQNQIELLKNQMEEKDKQLQSKDELLKNFQILLRTEQENNVKLLNEKNNKKYKSIFDIFKKKNTLD